MNKNEMKKNNEMKGNKMKKITKKSVIRSLLLDELKSEEMQQRIIALGHNVKLEWDMLVDDESRIKFIDGLRKSHKKIPCYKGRATTMFLTTRGYILLMAYKKSYSEIKDMRNLFNMRLNSNMESFMRTNAWYYELMRNCEFVQNEINEMIR